MTAESLILKSNSLNCDGDLNLPTRLPFVFKRVAKKIVQILFAGFIIGRD